MQSPVDIIISFNALHTFLKTIFLFVDLKSYQKHMSIKNRSNCMFINKNLYFKLFFTKTQYKLKHNV